MRLSLTARILASFLLLSLVFVAFSVGSIVQIRRVGRDIRALKDGYLKLYGHAKELQLHHGSLRLAFEQDVTRWEPQVRESLTLNLNRRTRELALAREALAALEALGLSEDDRPFLARALTDIAWLEGQFAEDMRELDTPGPVAARRERWNKVNLRLQRLSSPVRQKLSAVAARLTRNEEQATQAAWGGVVASLLVGILVTLAARSRLAQLRALAKGARALAMGDYSGRVPEDTRDEIGLLGHEFNVMATALREREARLLRSERLAAIGRMASHIAHEVRNPLASVGLNAELLEEELQGSPEGLRLCRAIQAEVDRLTTLTEEYLRLGRLPQPRLDLCDMRTIVASLAEFMGEEARQRGVDLKTLVPAEMLPARVDEGQIRQALLNLCRNAMDAMPSGGTLTLSATSEGGWLEIAVADTGIGMEPDQLGRIFDPFFSTKEHGTGLGLPLTEHVIAAHGGTIAVESTPGKGTVFRIRLPAAARAEQGASERTEVAPPESEGKAQASNDPETTRGASLQRGTEERHAEG